MRRVRPGPAEAVTQLLKGMGVEISKMIKNLETTGKNAEGPTRPLRP